MTGESPHKRPVTQKIFSFDGVVMDRLRKCGLSNCFGLNVLIVASFMLSHSDSDSQASWSTNIIENMNIDLNHEEYLLLLKLG